MEALHSSYPPIIVYPVLLHTLEKVSFILAWICWLFYSLLFLSDYLFINKLAIEMCVLVFYSYSFGIWVLTQEYTTMVVDKHAGSFSFLVEFCWSTTRGHSFYDNGYNFTQLFSYSLFCPCLHMCSLVHMYMFVCILLSAMCLCLF